MTNKTLIYLILLIFITSCKERKSTEIKSFYSERMKMQFEYPSYYQLKFDSIQHKIYLQDTLISTPKNRNNILIWLEEMPLEISDTIYAKASFTQQRILTPEIQLIDEKIETINGNCFFIYKYIQNPQENMQTSFATLVKQNRGYNIQSSSSKEYLNTQDSILQTLLQSFKTL